MPRFRTKAEITEGKKALDRTMLESLRDSLGGGRVGTTRKGWPCLYFSRKGDSFSVVRGMNQYIIYRTHLRKNMGVYKFNDRPAIRAWLERMEPIK